MDPQVAVYLCKTNKQCPIGSNSLPRKFMNAAAQRLLDERTHALQILGYQDEDIVDIDLEMGNVLIRTQTVK